ncbi:MAG TPA: metalloregulator ArsR/SmtB family transcription factor [Amaricoccus sp.]|nr:metalloregulator ArsR/SmtB family transcription factor [Amaricoccus sp.]
MNAVLHALGDPTRRRMLSDLARGERAVGELAEPFDMSLAAASKHIKVLENAGLIRPRDPLADARLPPGAGAARQRARMAGIQRALLDRAAGRGGAAPLREDEAERDPWRRHRR